MSSGSAILTLAMQRSGQHLVIRWIAHCAESALHLNNCRFERRGLQYVLAAWNARRIIYRGGEVDDASLEDSVLLRTDLTGQQFDLILYSLEDPDLTELQLRRVLARPHTRGVLIMRDPFNWLASVMHRDVGNPNAVLRKLALYKQHLRNALGDENGTGQPLVVVNFGRFLRSESYRLDLAMELGLTVTDVAEHSLAEIADFGGGSSFSGTAAEDNHAKKVESRWEHFMDDATYRELISDNELQSLARRLFSDSPGFLEAACALGVEGS
ncbi:MAG: hypothetical protein HKN49_13725 [Gammaproteobacteria bacterium]|nr:hypothetical protein [Gammaproteobacteria bacterium]